MANKEKEITKEDYAELAKKLKRSIDLNKLREELEQQKLHEHALRQAEFNRYMRNLEEFRRAIPARWFDPTAEPDPFTPQAPVAIKPTEEDFEDVRFE